MSSCQKSLVHCCSAQTITNFTGSYIYDLLFTAVQNWAICNFWKISLSSPGKDQHSLSTPNLMSQCTNTVLGNSYIHTDYSLMYRYYPHRIYYIFWLEMLQFHDLSEEGVPWNISLRDVELSGKMAKNDLALTFLKTPGSYTVAWRHLVATV